VIDKPSNLGNYVIADTFTHVAVSIDMKTPAWSNCWVKSAWNRTSTALPTGKSLTSACSVS